MKDGSKFARPGIMDLSPYVAGKPAEEVQAEYGLAEIVKLASNENSLGVSPKAAAVVAAEVEKCFAYPEGSSPNVRKALAKHWNVSADQIFVTCGGDQIITLFAQAFVGPGDEVIVGAPSFHTYNSSTVVMGGKVVKVPLQDGVYDLDAILAAITPKTKLIYFCNPNNPTGTIVGKQKVADFMSKVPDHCIVIFDEAYYEFVCDPDYGDGIEYIKKGANVIVLRTFSKVYGLAGMRIGYGIFAEHLVPVMGRIIPPFPVNRMAQVAAEAALQDTEFLEKTRKNNNDGRDYLNGEFDKLGLHYYPSHGNFIFVDLGMPAIEANEQLLRRGVIIRPGNGWGFPNHIRVTIGLPAENRKFIEALTEVLAEYKK